MEISELIMRLADNELSQEEREELEKILYKDPRLMQEYLTYLEMNDFLKEKFATKETEKRNLFGDDKKESAGKKSLDAEKEAFNKGTFYSTIDLVKEIKEEGNKKKYSDDLKEFAAIGIKEMKGKVNWGDENTVTIKKTVPKTRILRKWYFLAASITVFLSISILLTKSIFTPADYSGLFASYYQPYFFVVEQTRSSDRVLDSLVNGATELYKSGNYAQASKIIRNALEINNKHVKAIFIYGLTMLEVKNYARAADEFKMILAGYDSYQIESKWYLALCYLQLDKPGEAKKLLVELGLSKNLYQKRALDLLDAIGD